jgi:RNA polymerase sigma-70 factor (ECF subfamily)
MHKAMDLHRRRLVEGLVRDSMATRCRPLRRLGNELDEDIAVTLVSMEHATADAVKTADGLAKGDRLDELDWRQCRQCVAGAGDVCASLFKRHEPKIARQMWRFSRDRAAHAELVQEVFVQAYLSLHRYRPGPSPFENWLTRIATRVGYQFWKQQARRARVQPLEGLNIPAPASGDDDAVEAAQTLHVLLSQLPTADRLVLTLMYFEDCGIIEIAERTGWNRAMVKMRLYRARGRLRRIIEQQNLTNVLWGDGHGRA